VLVVNLKCGEKYEFHNLKRVIIDDIKIKATGNFKHGKRYKTIELNREMISNKSYDKMLFFLDDKFKRFDYIGVCPHCSSDRVSEHFKALVLKPINMIKPKYDIKKLEKEDDIDYYCSKCHKTFPKDDLIEINKVVFYK
jgi:hypothetical protein